MKIGKIESGVAITDGRGRPCKYPFMELKKGESFLVTACEGESVAKIRGSLSNLAFRYATSGPNGRKFTTRAAGEESIRVFRIR